MSDRYPRTAGSKGLTGPTQEASEEAATAIHRHRKSLFGIAMRTLAALGEAAPFEAVAASGAKPSALQPRFSEMIAEGLATPTGERRRNPDTGKTAAVLTLTDLARERLEGGAP